MSEPATTVRRMKNRLTHQQFFQAAEKLKELAAEFQAEKPKYSKAIKRISREVGFTIHPQAFFRMQEVTGVTWELETEESHITYRVGANWYRRLLSLEKRLAFLEFNLGIPRPTTPLPTVNGTGPTP